MPTPNRVAGKQQQRCVRDADAIRPAEVDQAVPLHDFGHGPSDLDDAPKELLSETQIQVVEGCVQAQSLFVAAAPVSDLAIVDGFLGFAHDAVTDSIRKAVAFDHDSLGAGVDLHDDQIGTVETCPLHARSQSDLSSTNCPSPRARRRRSSASA
ncbi:hypothetical protein [Candidatus Poriferisodalis sp.]|uniref:hypothetical protein n=1 Tax=Candidatus Poriferisodalis sp. TaxID=3101277 RepID=UPI003C704C87